MKELEGERPDFGPYLRQKVRPEWVPKEIWDSDLALITPKEWERINAKPESKVYIGSGTMQIMDSQRETTTPPPLPVEDPDTPRKGKKRMVKEAEAEGFKKFAAEGEVKRSSRKRMAKKK